MDYREKRREQKPNPRNTWLVVESDRVGQVNKRLGKGTCALLMLKEMVLNELIAVTAYRRIDTFLNWYTNL